jgi:hypothetical protein
MAAEKTPVTRPMSAFAVAHGATTPARAARRTASPGGYRAGRLRRALPPFVRALFA